MVVVHWVSLVAMLVCFGVSLLMGAANGLFLLGLVSFGVCAWSTIRLEQRDRARGAE